jgi:integrating conjugative element relaxase (TIGR03760 family)
MRLSNELLAALGTLVIAGSVAAIYLLLRSRPAKPEYADIAPVLAEGFLPVQSSAALLSSRIVNGPQLTAEIKTRSRATTESFEACYLPVISRIAELVQLLPASEAHHHADPGGMLRHTLETASIALAKRQAIWLPTDAPPEIQARHAHRWTFAVFVAAMLHEIGKPFVDLDIVARRVAGDEWAWTPLAGSLAECGANSYQVNFAATREYAAHSKLPMMLFQNCVPQPAVSWLNEAPGLIESLRAYLDGSERKSALARLAIEADSDSVQRDLMSGTRARFMTARSKPLIESLMAALRAMLADGGYLPLNRSGAAGWVYDRSVWLVSKRLADAVRDYLKEHDAAKGIPGPDKNDRLFDTWQEYGACLPNPVSHGAVWRVRVEGEGYSHELTVLRFPIEQLFSTLQLPTAMNGSVRVLDESSEKSATIIPIRPTAESSVTQVTAQNYTENRTNLTPTGVTTVVSMELDPAKTKSIPSVATDVTVLKHDDTSLAAAEEDRERAHVQAVVLKPVAPAIVLPPTLTTTTKEARSIPEEAKRFMHWIQTGLASGEMIYNAPEALIHFTTDGMLLVSPAVFRHFAAAFGEDGRGAVTEAGTEPGSGIQKAVLKAGWHARASGKNIVSWQVMSRGKAVAKLSGVLILKPEQFVQPVPAANPHLVRTVEESTPPTMGRRT